MQNGEEGKGEETMKEKNCGRREGGSRKRRNRRERERGRGAGVDCRKSLVPFQGTSIELASARVR